MASSAVNPQIEFARLSERSRICFSAFAIALGLSLIFGFLIFLREPPKGEFHGEWVALVFFACAAGLLLPVLPRRFPVSMSLLSVPLVLALLLAVQIALGRYSYVQDAVIWFGYLCLAVLAMLLGQGIRAAGLNSEVTSRLAWALMITAVLNACTQIIQVTHTIEIFAPFVVRFVDGTCRMYGNVGQANQASTLAWLGLGAAMYLYGIGRFASRWALPIIAVLLIGSALSASRMAWLFLGVMIAIVLFLPAWPAKDKRSRMMIAAMLLAGFTAASFGAGLSLAGIDSACASGVARLASDQDGGMAIRLELWRQAVDVWRTSPLLGVGAFRFLPTVYALESLDVHRPLDIYAHNMPLQILAEFGLIGAGVLGATVIFWLAKLVGQRRQLLATDAVLLLWLGVIGTHAMLEFPLWYTHFLLVFCLVLGLLIRPEWAKRSPILPFRAPILALVVALLSGSVYVFYDYRQLDRLFWLEDQRRAFAAAPTPEVRRLVKDAAANIWLFRSLADHLLGLSDPISKENLKRKIADTDRLLAHSPHSISMARRVLLSVLAGDLDVARWHLRRMFGFFAREREIEVMAGMMRNFIKQRPEDFAALGPMIDEEIARRPKPRW